MRRLFIAINIPDDLKIKLDEFRKEYEKKFPGRWVKKENMHLTVLFLGYTEEKNIPKIMEMISAASENNLPTEIKFQEIIPFPSRQPRMIWLSGDFSKKLQIIKDYLETELKKEKIPYKHELRELHPHINLVRFNNAPKIPFKSIHLRYSFQAARLDLMESRLSRLGANYKSLTL